ncbi:DEAD/DEAH box helicase [Kocuria sp.]|uniref:DEAD/DEAH box helicase n=1 Tax=Kocuria sp. TaxID=1871328 RepID=UPI0026DF136E|nr:DEAD/DEAH box helicase family protein [Kocuria sp.]MDO5619648.1 DEAD/DEAH box helicase family protein [Kocuria sp.]
MRYTLKDYQQDAVRDILSNLAEAREMFHNPRLRRTSQFALTATTGAGKTVMAAAVIEALFYGHDELGFEPDESAVVLWFSDDPNLNEQTRFRLLAASDELTHSDLRVIAHPFSEEKLSPGKVYFLNTDKLTKTSRLTRGHDAGDEDNQIPDLRASVRPDLQGFTIWDTLRNTIEDPNLTLYMVLDEAHRGFGTKASADKPTILRRLVNGHAEVPPMPVVWGVSATVDRFEQAMKAAEVAASRRGLDRVQVDPARVHASGLLKDTIVLDIPAETGVFDTVLLTRATRKIKESTAAWAEYAAVHADQTGDGSKTDPVVPLMVLQIPNTPDPDTVARALDVVFDEWPELGGDEVAHVLGDHTTQTYGPYAVRHISPERVQDDTSVRVLIAKDGISTGWDCPRAEVLMSFRPAKDATHITQLLGRLVRTPLAMRIEGNEVLNSVECILPFFDRKTATQVVQILTGELDGFPDPTGRRVLIRPETMTPNPDVPDSVWDALVSLPSQSLPRKGAKPVKRLTALAHALAVDGLRPDAGADAHKEMHAVLNGAAARHKEKLDAAVSEIWTVHGEAVAGHHGQTGVSLDRFTEVADDRSIRDAYRQAGRVFSPDLAGTYVDLLAGPDDDQDDDGLRDAYVQVAALALVPEVGDDLDREAEKLTREWFDQYRVAIKDLTPERQAVYNDIRAMSVDPQRMDLTRPKNALVETAYPPETEDSEPKPMPTRPKHLLAGADGQYPVGTLNDLELEVLDRELARPGAAGWYRNPARSAQDSLGIAYKDAQGTWKTMRPDFVFFDHTGPGVRVSIVDPHGHHLSDALVKLRGLAAFAAEYGEEFHRIEATSRTGDQTRVLDLKNAHVRAAVDAAGDAKSLYESPVAGNY